MSLHVVPEREKKDYSIPFEPTEFDLTRFKIWFMVGDQVPFEMICPVGKRCSMKNSAKIARGIPYDTHIYLETFFPFIIQPWISRD